MFVLFIVVVVCCCLLLWLFVVVYCCGCLLLFIAKSHKSTCAPIVVGISGGNNIANKYVGFQAE